MPPSETPTAPDASAKSGRSDASSAGGDPKPGSAYDVRVVLKQAADLVDRSDAQKAAKDVERQLDALLTKLVPVPDPDPNDDPCRNTKNPQNPQIPGFCFTRQQAVDQADFTYTEAVEDAATALEAAKRTWARALGTYDFAMRTADNALQTSVAQAVAAYDLKINKDSSSRQNFLYYTMKQAVATAMVTYEGAATSAGATLAAAVGTLVAAYQTYLATVGTAGSTALEARAAAMATFWGSVEGVLDS